MKMKSWDPTLIASSGEILQIKYSPVIQSKDDYLPQDYVMACTLKWVQSFVDRIVEAREEISLDTLITYPKNPSYELIQSLIELITDAKGDALRVAVAKIARVYHLADPWKLSIQTAILTGVLLVPHKEGLGIKFEYPGDTVGLSAILKRQQYPSIYFTKKVTLKAFIKWITDYQEIFDAMVFHLPESETREFRGGEPTIYWGQIAWILVSGRESEFQWKDICKKIDEFIMNDNKIHPENYKELNVYNDTPEADELQRYYERFCKSVDKLANI